MRGFEYDWRKVDVFDVTDSVVSFESHDTIVEVVIDSNKVLLENIKNEINQIRYLQSDKTSVVIKGAGTVMFLTGIAGLIINANHTEKILEEAEEAEVHTRNLKKLKKLKKLKFILENLKKLKKLKFILENT